MVNIDLQYVHFYDSCYQKIPSAKSYQLETKLQAADGLCRGLCYTMGEAKQVKG